MLLGPAAMRPAGAQTQKAPAEDRNPSPAARRDAEPPRSEREAAGPKSRIPKEAGPGAAPRGTVGGGEQTGPTAAAGPGAAPSAAQAAVSPAGEQTDSPGRMGAPAPEGAQAAPEASLEKDGGGCAPPEPAAEKEEGGGSCGGGGGGAAPEEKQEEPPDVSGQDPKAAIGTVSKLAPDQAAAAMPGVDAAADKKIGDEQRRLDANPPKRERPSGAPQTQSGPPEAAAPADRVTGKVEKLGPEDRIEKQKAKGSEKAEGAKPTDNTPPPPAPVADKLTAEEAKNVDAAADAVPTVDPELQNKTVGPAPKIRLEGESDPKRTDDQAKALKEKQSDIQSTGREDAAKPMGEDQIFPNAPQEQLVGKATAGGRRGGGGGLEAGSAPKPGVGAVAKQERGSEIQGAAGQAQETWLSRRRNSSRASSRPSRRSRPRSTARSPGTRRSRRPSAAARLRMPSASARAGATSRTRRSRTRTGSPRRNTPTRTRKSSRPATTRTRRSATGRTRTTRRSTPSARRRRRRPRRRRRRKSLPGASSAGSPTR